MDKSTTMPSPFPSGLATQSSSVPLPHVTENQSSPVMVLCSNASSVAPAAAPANKTSPDALLYIVVVLAFYALAMIILMIKYVRRENQEAQLTYYFMEFIKRDKFSSAEYQNRQDLKAVTRVLRKLYPATVDKGCVGGCGQQSGDAELGPHRDEDQDEDLSLESNTSSVASLVDERFCGNTKHEPCLITAL